ncbi:MAG: tripartite tricarboxylate transporter substrate binding protein [Bacillota bacterium]
MRKYLSIMISTVLLIGLFSVSSLAAYPEKSITIICPWSAGGGTDQLARFVAAELEKELGQPVVVSNKTGGSGAVGHSAGAYAKEDGYTVTLVTLDIATIHWLGLSKVNYADFDYIIQLNQDPAGLMVKGDAEWDNANDFLEDIKNNPKGEFKFSGSATGTIWDLARVGMLDAAGISPQKVKWIPTGGAAPSITELLGGHIEAITCSLAEASGQLESGDIKPLAVMADSRNESYPNVPTLKEQGIDWSAGTWRGLAVPKGTPQEIVDKLYDASYKIATSDKYKEFMSRTGFNIKLRNSEEFAEFAKKQDTVWKEVLEIGGFLNK